MCLPSRIHHIVVIVMAMMDWYHEWNLLSQCYDSTRSWSHHTWCWSHDIVELCGPISRETWSRSQQPSCRSHDIGIWLCGPISLNAHPISIVTEALSLLVNYLHICVWIPVVILGVPCFTRSVLPSFRPSMCPPRDPKIRFEQTHTRAQRATNSHNKNKS